jgi:hypothetical protein
MKNIAKNLLIYFEFVQQFNNIEYILVSNAIIMLGLEFLTILIAHHLNKHKIYFRCIIFIDSPNLQVPFRIIRILNYE